MKRLILFLVPVILLGCQKPEPVPTISMMLIGEWEKTEEFIDDVNMSFTPLHLNFTENILTVTDDSVTLTMSWEYVKEGDRDLLLLRQNGRILEKDINFINEREVYFQIAPGCNCVERFEKR